MNRLDEIVKVRRAQKGSETTETTTFGLRPATINSNPKSTHTFQPCATSIKSVVSRVSMRAMFCHVRGFR